jgi:hypothetical protein
MSRHTHPRPGEAARWYALADWAATQGLDQLFWVYQATAIRCRADLAETKQPDTRRHWGQAGGTRS